MASQKLYTDDKERQKSYRERKKKSGYRGVLVLVPEYLLLFIKGEPSKLSDSFITLNKNLFIEFNYLAYITENGDTIAILRNDDGIEWKVKDRDQIKSLERFKEKVRLFVDGRLEVIQ